MKQYNRLSRFTFRESERTKNELDLEECQKEINDSEKLIEAQESQLDELNAKVTIYNVLLNFFIKQ